MSKVILGYLPDLLSETRVREALAAHRATLYNARHGSWPDRAPRLVIVAFGLPGENEWEDLIRQVRKRWSDVPIVAFGPHVALDARRRARDLGATLVLARGRFFEMLPTLLESYLSDDPMGCEGEPHPLLIEGVRLFNAGEYYRCHEVLEDAWRSDLRPCRDLYQGILQLGICLYHIRRGNHRGARKMALRALRHLRSLPSRCQGVEVEAIRAETQAILARLQQDAEARVQADDLSVIIVM